MKDFDATLVKNKTSYALRKAIILDIRAWRKQTALPMLQYVDTVLKAAIEEQHRIGWKTFLEGLLSTKIVNYQQDFLKHQYPDRKVVTWAKRVIKAGWKILLGMWENRNENLHKPNVLQEMEGIKILNWSICKEWKIGLSDLPTFEFSAFFRMRKEKLMKKSLEGKKDWLANVKMAREVYGDKNIRYDEFDTDEALRLWIGLPDKKDYLHSLSV